MTSLRRTCMLETLIVLVVVIMTSITHHCLAVPDHQQSLSLSSSETDPNTNDGNDFFVNDDDDDNDDVIRRKRLIFKDPLKHWEKGVVPYKLDPSLTKWEKDAVLYTIGLYEKYTPIRFVAMDDTASVYTRYGIREGFAHFRHKGTSGSCQAQVGKRATPKGQEITCCWGDTCTHEVGHLLGFKHEMSSPKRDSWINILDKNIPAATKSQYVKWDQNPFLDVPFDLYSTMQYKPNTGGVQTYTFNFPDLAFRWKRTTYYLFQELCIAYKCSEFPQCQNTTLKCVNDGYISVVDGKCACLCPPGFDPSHGCDRPINTKCGGVINLSNENRVATVTSDRREHNQTNCYWIIRGDPKQEGTLIMNFDDFDVRWGSHTCFDQIWVTYTRLGHPGILYCGPGVKHSIRSVLKDIRLEFKTQTTSASHFEATVTWKPASELCYHPGDKGASYAGLVNYTRDYKPCMAWDEAREKCPVHPFQGGQAMYTLQGNTCRNPDDSFRPWCYVDLNTCEKNYCDVCQDEKPYDLSDQTYCDKVKADGACSTNHAEATRCARTCGIKEKDSKVTCPRQDISDATLLHSKSSYSEGESATYECRMGPHYRTEKTCLTDGTWSVGNTPCTVCPIGWSPLEGKCYKYMAHEMTYDQAKSTCVQEGGLLATPTSNTVNDFFNKLRQNEVIWLGSYLKDKKIYLEDGSLLSWTNWIGTTPRVEFRHEVYILQIRDGLWSYMFRQNSPYRFVCQREIAAQASCVDYLDNCEYYANTSDNVSCNKTPELHNLCRYTCGWCVKHIGG